MIHLHESLRDPRFQVPFSVEVLDQALDDLAYIHIHIGLHCDIDLGSVVTGQTRQAIKGVADRVEPGERNLERALLLCLRCDLSIRSRSSK
jgi:hypothetical protein